MRETANTDALARSPIADARERLEELWETEPGLVGWLSTVDHKLIGKRYLVTAFLFLLAGGVEALLMRIQLSRADLRVLTPEAYNQIFTMHGMTMIFWYASPILSGFGNYLIPLIIGARDMAFPRLNAFSYWTFLLSGLFLYASVPMGESPHAGWFAYAPLTERPFSPGLGMDFYCLALIFLTVSTTVGAINFIVTILRHRAVGMTLARMPLLNYSTLTISFSIVFSLPALTAACVFLELERRWGFHFFDAARGGDPLLWQQVFWFFGHPWVYIIFLPATGMISLILPVFARRPIVGFPYVAGATVLTGVAGFAVWVHHMFAVGMNHSMMSFFSAASMTISLFSTVQVMAWLGTLWKGKPVLTTSMLFALGFVAALVIGGLSGVVTAVIPVDWQVHDTYFVLAHLHYVLVGANMLPVFAAFYYWLPKMTGRLLDERLGKWSFWLTFLGFNVTFFPMHFTGALGMPRRVFTYGANQGWEGLNLASTLGAVLMSVGILVSLYNFIRSQKVGALAGNNPWNADTLEWGTTSPPPAYGTVHLPTVVSRHPLWDAHDEEADPGSLRVLDQGRLTLTTSFMDAVPFALAKTPEDTVSPLLLALALTGVFVGLLIRSPWVIAAACACSLAAAAFWLWPEKEKESPVPSIGIPLVQELDDRRGTLGMWLFIATEASLFVMFFWSWFYLSPWVGQKPSPLGKPLVMLAVLLTSSGVLEGAKKLLEKGRATLARALLAGTIALGIAFLVIQGLEYAKKLKEVSPKTGAFGSLFFTLTGVHGLHVALGLCLLTFALVLPSLRPYKPPHRSLQNAALYWHFVDVVWVFIVALVYVLPHLRASA